MGNTSPEKIWVDAANNYYVDNQQDDNLGAYIHADKVDKLLEQQREACGDKAFQYMDEHTGVTWEVFIAGVQQAILNAVEKA